MATGKGSAYPTEKTTLLRKKILELRRQGYNFEVIAEELGYSNTYVRRQFKKALNAIIQEDVEEVRKMEALKLDALEAEVHKVLSAFIPYISNGRIVLDAVFDENGRPVIDRATNKPLARKVQDLSPKLQSVDRLLKVMERRAKLLGLDKPTKYATTDVQGNDVVRPITVEMTLEEAAEAYAESRLPSAVFEPSDFGNN